MNHWFRNVCEWQARCAQARGRRLSERLLSQATNLQSGKLLLVCLAAFPIAGLLYCARQRALLIARRTTHPSRSLEQALPIIRR
jgi:hypothetical protein